MDSNDFIEFLKQEFSDYHGLTEPRQRKEKKQFINGLMTASRFFGVSYDELKAIVATHRAVDTQDEHYLDIPTFIRQAKPDC
ncbi:hypothetical protein [Vibrio rotiferianus]|uniref:hypothetical protein n=1 Tax=Vibrio rotiferianus TaxID=190895 RepID=UPI000237796C|nr:hypothetical protein [Vibrio rotiferianus]